MPPSRVAYVFFMLYKANTKADFQPARHRRRLVVFSAFLVGARTSQKARCVFPVFFFTFFAMLLKTIAFFKISFKKHVILLLFTTAICITRVHARARA